MATNYDEYMKEMFPQTASDATKQYYTGQQENIDKAYVEGANTLGSNKDQTIAQAYLSYLKATNPYGSSAEQRSNAGLSASGGYAGVTRGYAEMAQANSKIAANNTYQSGMTNLAANRDAAQTNLLGNYASMLSTDETNAYNKKQTALSQASDYMLNVVDYDAYKEADNATKTETVQSWKDTMVNLYGLDETTADTLINSYLVNINNYLSLTDIDLNSTYEEVSGEYTTGDIVDDAVNTSLSESIDSPVVGKTYKSSDNNYYTYTNDGWRVSSLYTGATTSGTNAPVTYEMTSATKGLSGGLGGVYVIDGKEYNMDWNPVMSDKSYAAIKTAVANVSSPVGGKVYQGSDGNYYYYFGDTSRMYKNAWRKLEEN